MTARGLLAILSGPSGVGKSTIIERLVEDDRFSLSVSATTRKPREGEENGVDYWFLDMEDFEARIAAGEFLEHAVVHGRDRYGTLRSEVERRIADGAIVILDIDVQGAAALKNETDAVSVFIAPPDVATLEERLRTRGTEDEAAVTRRMETAREELARQDEYDRVVVNDGLVEAVARVREILVAAADNDDRRQP